MRDRLSPIATYGHRLSGRVAAATIVVAIGLVPLLAAAPARAAAPSHALLFSLFANEQREGPSPPHAPYPPPLEGFEDPCGVAVDSNGDIYVADYYHDLIDVFTSSGAYLTQIATEDPGNGPCGLALDSAGNLYVNNSHQDVVKFTPSEFPPSHSTKYGSPTTIDSGGSTGVAVDPATGNVYVDDRTHVVEYGPSGNPLAEIGLGGSLKEGYGVAVSDFPATSGYLYVPDAATDTVKVYNPAGEPLNPVGVIDGAGTPQSGFHSLVDSAVAVDNSDGHVYVADNLQTPFEHPAAVIDEFNSSGAYRGQLPHFIADGEPPGLAVDGAGHVYATSGNSEDGYGAKNNTEVAVLFAFGPTEPAHSLKVSKSGAGKGAVTSAPAGIDCGAACEAEYNEGESVTLTAAGDPHSAFSGWTVNGSAVTCPGTGPCHLILGVDTEVSAEFAALPQKALTVEKTGTGTVTSSPEGIDCGPICTAEFNEGGQVTLTAKPIGLGSAFSGWTVNGNSVTCPGTGTCEVTMSEDTTVKANFETVPIYPLTVSKTGAGTVSSEPPGIQCGATCSAEYNQGTEVTLTATPGAHQAFTGWTGATCPGIGTCEVTMSQARSLSATFAPIFHTLTVAKSGSGSGSVSSSPAGIDCGVTCSAEYEEGSQLTLTAVPAPGSAFSGWSGGGCAGTRTCKVTLGADTALSATFVSYPREEITPPHDQLTLGSARSAPSGTAAALAVTVPAPGALTATGKGLKSARANVSAPGTTTLRLVLSGAGKKTLSRAKGHKLGVKITVSFTPSDGSSTVTATKTVTFKAKGGGH